jgi:hypothetical protein
MSAPLHFVGFSADSDGYRPVPRINATSQAGLLILDASANLVKAAAFARGIVPNSSPFFAPRLLAMIWPGTAYNLNRFF